jgi:hypothetical protein
MHFALAFIALFVPATAFAGWDFATSINGAARPSAGTGEGLNLSPSPVSFTLAGTAATGTEAHIVLASADCADGSCSVAGRVATSTRTVVRRVATAPRRIFAGRPVRSFLGRVRCGLLGGCR